MSSGPENFSLSPTSQSESTGHVDVFAEVQDAFRSFGLIAPRITGSKRPIVEITNSFDIPEQTQSRTPDFGGYDQVDEPRQISFPSLSGTNQSRIPLQSISTFGYDSTSSSSSLSSSSSRSFYVSPPSSTESLQEIPLHPLDGFMASILTSPEDVEVRSGDNIWVGHRYSKRRIQPLSLYLNPVDLATQHNNVFPEDTTNANLTVPHDAEPYDILAVLSPKDTGKTYQFVRFITHMYRVYGHCRFCVVTCRKTLSSFLVQSLQDEFNGLHIDIQVQNYMDYKELTPLEIETLTDEELARRRENAKLKNLVELDHIVIQLDSLHHVFDENGHRRYDVLILDEFQSTLAHLAGSHFLKEKLKWTDFLTQLIKASGKVIIADADFNQSSVMIVDAMLKGCQKRIMVSCNEYRPDLNMWELYHASAQLLSLIACDVLAGKKLVIPTNSLKWCTLCYTYLQTFRGDFYRRYGRRLKIFILSGETLTDANRITYLDPVTWRVDVFLYTSTLMCGPSFNYVWFDRLYGYFSTGTTTAEESCQMLLRVRRLRDKVCRLMIKGKRMGDFMTTIEELRQQSRLKYQRVEDFGEETKRLLYVQGENAFINDIYTQIYMNHQIEKRISYQNLSAAMVANIKRTLANPDGQLKEDIETKHPKLGLKEIKERIIEWECTQIYNSPDLDQREMDALCNRQKNGLTEQEGFTIKRNKMRTFYNVLPGEMNIDFIREWGRRIKGLTLFSALYLQNAAEIVQHDQRDLIKYTGDSLLEFEFRGDIKEMFTDICECIGFDIRKVCDFTYPNETVKSQASLDRLNKILPRVVLRAAKNYILPTKVEAKNIMDFGRTFFYLTGLHMKTVLDPNGGEKAFKIDVEYTCKVLDRLVTKYQNNESMLRRILEIQESILETRDRL